MNSLFASLLLPALLIAANPVPIIVAVTLLTADHGRRNAGLFAATLIGIMCIVGGFTLFLVGQAASSGQTSTRTGSNLLTLAFGIFFLVLFVMQWRNRPAPGDADPKWMTMMNKAGFGVAIVLGVSLTNYALLSDGTTTILKAHVSLEEQIAGLVFFIIVAVSTVVVPLVIYLVRRDWAEVQLNRLKEWLTVHNRALLLAVFGIMGLMFTVQGLAKLLH